MNILLLLFACFGVAAVSALTGRPLAKRLMLDFIIAFALAIAISVKVMITALDLSLFAPAIVAIGSGLIILCDYKLPKTMSISLVSLSGLVLGFAGHLHQHVHYEDFLFIALSLIAGFFSGDHLCRQPQAKGIKAKRIVGVFMLVAVFTVVLEHILFDHHDLPQQTSFATSGKAIYTGQETIDEQKDILESLISNIYFAFNANDESEVYDQLALSVDGPILTDLYLQQRRSLLLKTDEGTKIIVRDVKLLEAKKTSAESGKPVKGMISFKANWQASGSVNHSEHEHDRINRYEAIVSIAPVDNIWKIISLQLLDEQRTVQESDTEEGK